MNKFNTWLAIKITNAVSTMWCAYVFALLALISFPDAIRNGRATVVSWVAQTFLQLVLLSVIMVGQNIRSQKIDDLKEHVTKIHKHLGIEE